jgi:hypothetical protein
MDNWKHRSDGMLCKTCMYFVLKVPSDNFGRCRRHAPTMSGFPAIFDTDWCGDHKLDENKLTPGTQAVEWGTPNLVGKSGIGKTWEVST